MGCTRSPFSGGLQCCAFCTGPVNPDVIPLKHKMKFSLTHLFVAILVVAVLCTAFLNAPTATLSVLLLGLLPSIVFVILRVRSRRNSILLFAVFAPIAAYLFYLGMIGPLAATIAAPKEWGFLSMRHEIYKFTDWAYTPRSILFPILVFDPNGESEIYRTIFSWLQKYQSDWMDLVGSDTRKE